MSRLSDYYSIIFDKTHMKIHQASNLVWIESANKRLKSIEEPNTGGIIAMT